MRNLLQRDARPALAALFLLAGLLGTADVTGLEGQCAGYRLAEVDGNPSQAWSGKDVILVHGYITPSFAEDGSLFNQDDCDRASGRDPASDYWLVGHDPTTARWTAIVSSLQELGVRVWTWRWPAAKTIDEAALYLRDAVRRQGLEDEIVLVGHSMGGLVSLAATAQGALPLRDRILRVVTLATPHQGTDFWAGLAETDQSGIQVQPSSTFIRQLQEARTLSDDEKTYVIGGTVPVDYTCKDPLSTAWNSNQGGDADCVVRDHSAYDSASTVESTHAVHRVTVSGSAFAPYDHSQMKLDFRHWIPNDGTSGWALTDSVRRRVVSDLVPNLALDTDHVSLTGASTDVSVAVANDALGSLQELEKSIVSGGEWLSASLTKTETSVEDPALLDVSADLGTLPPGEYRGAVEVSGFQAHGRRTSEILTVSLRIDGTAAPTLSIPASVVNPGSSFQLEWTWEPEAGGYILERSASSSFSTVDQTWEFTELQTETSDVISEASTTRYYRVRANNSDWSNTVSVSTNDGPADGEMVVSPSPISATGFFNQGRVRRKVDVDVSGVGSFSWTATKEELDATGSRWIRFTTNDRSISGTQDDSLTVILDADEVPSTGVFDGKVIVESGAADNSPVEVPVRFEVKSSSSSGVDLAVVSARWERSPVDHPDDPQLFWTTKNVGSTGYSGTFVKDRVYISRDGTMTWPELRDQFGASDVANGGGFTSLGPGATFVSEDEQDDLTPPDPGQWYYYIVTDVGDPDDPDGVAPETVDTDDPNTNNLYKMSLWLPGPPKLRVDPSSLSFTSVQGETKSQTIEIANDGYEKLEWSVSGLPDGLALERTSGSVAINSSASLGVYIETAELGTGTSDLSFTVSSNGGDRTVSVTADVSAPAELSVDTTAVVFSALEGTNPGPVELALSNAGGSSLDWEATVGESSAEWLAVQPGSGTIAAGGSQSLTLEVDGDTLAPGSYLGAVTVSAPGADGSPVEVSVDLTVEPGPALDASASHLSFDVVEGNDPADQTFGVRNTGGGSMDWTATTSTGDGGGWLSVTPGSGTLSAGASRQVAVSVSSASLPVGTYDGAIAIAAAGADGSPDTVSVRLRVASANEPPVASFVVSPSSPAAGDSVRFDASGSSDPDGGIVEYRWDLDGDGLVDRAVGGDTLVHVYPTAGQRPVRLVVEDGSGATDDTVRRVAVEEGAPGTAVIEAEIAVDAVDGVVGDTVTIPLRLNLTATLDSVAGYTLDLGWDPDRLTFRAVEAGGFGGSFTVNTDDVGSGSLSATSARATPTGGPVTTLLTLEVEPPGDLVSGSRISFTLDYRELVDAGSEDLLPQLEIGTTDLCVADAPYGDPTGDGRAGSADAVQVLRHSVGLTLAEGVEIDRADVSGDGAVGTADAVQILREVVGLALPASSRMGRLGLGACETTSTTSNPSRTAATSDEGV